MRWEGYPEGKIRGAALGAGDREESTTPEAHRSGPAALAPKTDLVWVATVGWVFLLILASLPTVGALAQSVQHPASSTSLGESQLRAAALSLEKGQGPAHGTPTTCRTSGGEGSLTCGDLAGSLPNLQWSPVGTPLGRSGVNMVYDAADGYVVLFSGGSSSSVQGDTWIFTEGRWTELNPSIAPSPRLGAYMTYYSKGGYVVLFGGWGGNSGPYEYGDTWAFSGGRWQLLIPQSSCLGSGGSRACPSPRDSGSMADDPSMGIAVLFGGYGGFGDTWEFTSGQWVELLTSAQCQQGGGTAVCPSPRQNAPMAWDPLLGGDILFGGDNGTALNDTWLFKGGVWQELVNPRSCTAASGAVPCPSSREESSLTFDSTDGYLVLFGGYNGTSDFSDTWYFLQGGWHYLAAASGCMGCPGSRSQAGLADDPAQGGLLMFGGYPSQADTWLYSGGSWTPVTFAQSAGPRWDASVAWDPASASVFLFGGFDGIALNDTWSFSGGTWTRIASMGSCLRTSCPSPRGGAALGWDETDQEMVLFGGMSTLAGGFLRDTWTFSSGNWNLAVAPSSCSSTTCPSARSNASMEWDSADSELVLFGGHGTSFDNDTWIFSGGAWSESISSSQCASQPCPSARFGASMAQAPTGSGGLVLFGGNTASGYVNDTWIFWKGSWVSALSPSQCLHVSCPSPRAGAAMDLDPYANAVVLFGGEKTGGVLSDTWLYSGGNWTEEALYGPSGRSYPSFVVDPALGGLLLVGGFSPYGALPDVWSLGSAFTVDLPSVTPAPSDLGQTLQMAALSGGGGAALPSFTWQGLPPGCAALPGSGAFSCIPTQAGQYYVTTVAVPSNGLPGATSDFLLVTVNPDPTVSLRMNSTTAVLGSNFSLVAQVTGGTTPYSQYRWSGLPPDCGGLVSTNSTLTCLPRLDSDVGVWQVTVSVLDAAGFNATSAALSLTLEVTPWSVAIVLDPPELDLGQYLVLDAQVTGFSGAFSFLWSGLPPGCAGTTGAIQCLPTSIGSYPVSVTAANGTAGSYISPTEVVTINPTLGTPTIRASASELDVGSLLTLAAQVNGGTAPFDYTWSGLPPGCLSADVPELTCSPSRTGMYNVTLRVTDATSQMSLPVRTMLQVRSPLASVVLSASSTALDLGETTTLTAAVTGNSTNVTYTWVGLPSGCTSNTTLLTCAPATEGSFTLALVAALPGGTSVQSNTVTLSVLAPLSAPAIEIGGGRATVGSPLTVSVEVSGGTQPYTYAWSNLPSGCVVADLPEFTCTPVIQGSSSISVTVTDATGAALTSNATVQVAAPASPAPSGGLTMDSQAALFFVLMTVALILAILLAALILRKDRSDGEPRNPRPGSARAGGRVPPASQPPSNPGAFSGSQEGEGVTPYPEVEDREAFPPRAIPVTPSGEYPASWKGYRPVPIRRRSPPEFGGYEPASGSSGDPEGDPGRARAQS